MAREQADELLPHHSGGAKNPHFDRLVGRSIHCAHDASITPIAKHESKKNPPTGCSVSGFVSSVYLRMFGAGCFIYSGRTYTTDLQSRLTRFRPMVLCVANILLSIFGCFRRRQAVARTLIPLEPPEPLEPSLSA